MSCTALESESSSTGLGCHGKPLQSSSFSTSTRPWRVITSPCGSSTMRVGMPARDSELGHGPPVSGRPPQDTIQPEGPGWNPSSASEEPRNPPGLQVTAPRNPKQVAAHLCASGPLLPRGEGTAVPTLSHYVKIDEAVCLRTQHGEAPRSGSHSPTCRESEPKEVVGTHTPQSTKHAAQQRSRAGEPHAGEHGAGGCAGRSLAGGESWPPVSQLPVPHLQPCCLGRFQHLL